MSHKNTEIYQFSPFIETKVKIYCELSLNECCIWDLLSLDRQQNFNLRFKSNEKMRDHLLTSSLWKIKPIWPTVGAWPCRPVLQSVSTEQVDDSFRNVQYNIL